MMTVAPPAVPDSTPSVPAPLRDTLATLHHVLPDAHLVGGAVRDLLMGRLPRDLDVVTGEDARQAAAALAAAFGGHAFALDDERAQYRIALPVAAPVREVDVSTIEDLLVDLSRRDYTIDAMAAPLRAGGVPGTVIDPHGGASDLQAGRLRMVSAENLADDPLRLLRAARLATELDFAIEPETAGVIGSLTGRLPGVAAERRRDELVRILESPRASSGVRLLDELGLLDVLLPELTPARGVEQPANHHYYDVFEHSLQALTALDEMLHDIPTMTGREWLGPDFRQTMAVFDLEGYLSPTVGGVSRLALLKLATLLHDVAKPETKSVEADGRIRFLGHPELGATKAEAISRRLRFGNREARFVSLLVEEHLRPTMLAQAGQAPSRRALYRFFRDLGEAAPACLILSLADAAAATGPRLQQERWRGHIAYCRYVLYEGSRLDSPEEPARPRLVNGNDLLSELGMEPGPAVGRVLSQLDEAQAVGEIETREQALEYARTLVNHD